MNLEEMLKMSDRDRRELVIKTIQDLEDNYEKLERKISSSDLDDLRIDLRGHESFLARINNSPNPPLKLLISMIYLKKLALIEFEEKVKKEINLAEDTVGGGFGTKILHTPCNCKKCHSSSMRPKLAAYGKGQDRSISAR